DRIKLYPDKDIPIDTTLGSISSFGKRAAKFKLKLRAEVTPPVSGGTTLQATHISISGNYAYVSYNVRGATYLGGVDVFNISIKNNPVLVSQAIFLNSDVSSVSYSNGKLYLAEATADTGFTYPAVVEEMTLANDLLSLTSRRVGVTSYVATDARVSGTKLYVTSGSGGPATGGLAVLDTATLQVQFSDPFLDARALAFYGTSGIVLQGTPARFRTYSSAPAFMTAYAVGGATIPESKSTIQVVLDRAFVGAGDAGAKVVDLNSGAVIDSIGPVTVTGIPSSLTVTNSVSVNKDILLLANGEAGVYVAQADIDMEATPSVSPHLVVLGAMQFGAAESANFVTSSNDVIFIATGLGGLKILEVQY
ncbi:MAG: hypothetical protein WBD36_03425, partial [Bacteroidota bacterium]